MAGLTPLDPLAQLRRQAPPAGPQVQNMGGLQPNTAPLANRPVAPPAITSGPPGPAPTVGQQNRQQGQNLVGQIRTGISNPAPAPLPQTAPPDPTPQTTQYPVVQLGSGMGAMTYGVSGGTSSTPGSLEQQLRDYIGKTMGGVTSKAFIDRARNQLGAATEGQRAVGVNRVNEDAIRRGLFRSGIPAENAAAVGTAAQGAFSSGLADILNNAEKTDTAARGDAAAQAGNLLGMNRSWDWQTQQRADEIAARNASAAAANASHGFVYVDPDTGESYNLDDRYL